MEDQQLITCMCTDRADAPDENFGWTRQELCTILDEVKNQRNFDNYLPRIEGYKKEYMQKFMRRYDDAFLVETIINQQILNLPFRLKRHSRNAVWLCYGAIQGLFYKMIDWAILDALKIQNRPIKQETDAPMEGNEIEERLYDALMLILEKAESQLKIDHPNYYNAFDLHFNRGYNHDQVAEKLGISKDLSWQHIARAKKKLFAYIEAEAMKVEADSRPKKGIAITVKDFFKIFKTVKKSHVKK